MEGGLLLAYGLRVRSIMAGATGHIASAVRKWKDTDADTQLTFSFSFIPDHEILQYRNTCMRQWISQLA